MKSRLKSSSRDNVTTIIRKADEGSTVTVSSVELPQISRVDTGSFVGLFDRFAGFGDRKSQLSDGASSTFVNVSTTGAKDFDWPALAPTISATARQTKKAPAMASVRSVVPNRNDSTGSSSVHSSGKSSVAPTITRHSSCSSVEDSSPIPPPKDDSPAARLTALPKVTKDEDLCESPGAIKKPSRSSTWGSTNSNRSQNLDLDKPLPIRPRRAGEVSKTVNFSRPQAPSTPQSAPLPGTDSRPHNRSVSLNVLAPSPSLSTSRQNQLVKTASRSISSSTRQRSQSATAVAELEGSVVHGVRPLAPRKKKTIQAPPRNYQITAHTAENVIYRVMTQLRTAEDLKSAALVSKGFYNTFHRNESKLVSHLMFQSSRAAWETRRSIIVLKSSKQFRLCDYQRDLRTLRALHKFILARAAHICRPATIDGLQGHNTEAQRLADEALWRIWTFCALFGANAHKAEPATTEVDWLNGYSGARGRVLGAGFGVGNGAGLTLAQLEDMNEMWQCLQVLVSTFHGRTEEASRAGVLDNWNPTDNIPETTHIVEWTSYLLTLGPQVILTLSSASFEKAKMLGLTTWVHPTPGQSRTTFLTSAISHVYQERLLAEATAKAASIPLPRQASARHRASISVDSTFSSTSQRAVGASLRLDTTTPTIRRRPLSVSAHRPPPLEIRPDCDPSSTTTLLPPRASPAFPASPTTDPTFYHTLTNHRAASTRLGPTLFPLSYTPITPRIPFPRSTTRATTTAIAAPHLHTPPPVPQIIDPVDRALNHLVSDCGYPEQNAKRALAMTDTGSGIDLARAEELLRIEYGRQRQREREGMDPVELPTPMDIVSPLWGRARASTEGAERCDGSCPPLPGAVVGSVKGKRVAGMSVVSAAGVKSVRGSVVSRATTVRGRHARSVSLGSQIVERDVSSEEEEGAATPVSPITDIYGGHSDGERDDMSLEWRREEGGGDTIAPLVSAGSPGLGIRTSGVGGGLGRMKSGKSLKAWRVLGVDAAGNVAGSGSVTKNKVVATLGSLGRSSSRGNVVGMQEYLARVEKRKEERDAQEARKTQMQENGEVFGVQSTEVIEGGKGGLGGLRPIVVEECRSSGEGKGSWRKSLLMSGGSSVRREKTIRDRVRCFPGGERLFLDGDEIR